MKKSKRILCTASIASAMVAALSAFAAGPAATASSNKVMLAKVPVQTSFDRFIVKYRDAAAQRNSTVALSVLNAAATRAGVAGMKPDANGVSTALAMRYVRKLAVGADVMKLSRALTKSEADALLAQLRSDPAVQYAQPDYRKHRFDVVPNDPDYGLQWHYSHPTAGIRAPTAWETSTGAGVVVAVIDTGYVDHSDLNGNIVAGYDFITDENIAGDGDGRDADAHDPGDWMGADDSSFHGTHVAGTVAAITNNGIGLAGVAYNARVQPVRVLGHSGGMSSDIADAITWASGGAVAGVPNNANPAEVLNLSLGGFGPCSGDPVTQAAIDGAIARGVTVVVAAGNANDNVSNFTPASCKGVIAVGANGVDGAKSWFSNYGSLVSVSAPGGNATSGSSPNNAWIWSLGNKGTQEPIAGPAGETLKGFIGTSMASPHVAGVVALMQSAAVAAGNPALTPAQVRTILRHTAQPFTVTPPTSTPMGTGIVNAAAAVAAAQQPIPATEPSVLLVSGRAVTAQSGVAGKGLLYSIDVPAGTKSLNLRSYGGTGDVTLYVSYDEIPTTIVYERKSAKPGNSEAVVVTNPAAGTWYVRMVGEKAFANVTVMAVRQ